jgi:hypothetical protein
MSEVNGERFGRRLKVVKSKCRLIAVVATQVTAAIFLLNQSLPSFSATMLLRDIVLMFVVCKVILASA